MELLIAAGIFVSLVLLLQGIFFVYRAVRNSQSRTVRSRLRKLSIPDVAEGIDIVRKRPLSEIPWLHRLLSRMPSAQQTDLLLQQSNSRYPLGVFVLLTWGLTFVGFVLTLLGTGNLLISVIVGLLLGFLPFLYLSSKKRRRMQKFERQLPEALDLVARSLRAGHAFSSGLKMASEEFDDPLGTEFAKTVDEINFGAGVTDALKNLVYRVDCPDLKFFAISVIIQKETGGNLAEILENISQLIRKRFQLLGHARILSAEGRLSAIILTLLPFFVAALVYATTPEYVSLLFTDILGNILIGVGALLMLTGVLIMKKLITIRV